MDISKYTELKEMMS